MPIGAVAALLLTQTGSTGSGADLRPRAPYDSAADPERTLGYSIGSRITTYRDQERALDTLERAYPRRLRKIVYGNSVKGRPLRVYIAGSERNVARWEAIAATNLRLAQEGGPIPADLPAIVWVNETIHGNEPASFESAMMLLYTLAASRSPKVRAALEQAVVVVNPCYNPDGHERFAVWYDSIARGQADSSGFEFNEPSAVAGRLNHFRFDMNRDRVAMSQDETRAEVLLYDRIRPHVYADQHGQVQNYFFPPNPMSVHAETDRARVEKWTGIFGRATAKEFDATGYSYFIRRDFDLFYPGYLDSFTTLSGAIGMTHETDGGKTLAKKRKDETVVTLREGVAKHLLSALAVIESAATHRSDLLASFADYSRRGREGVGAGEFRSIVLTGDPRPLKRVADQLARMGVTSRFIGATTITAKDYWKESAATARVNLPAGSLLVDTAQLKGQLARAMLSNESNFETSFAKEQMAKRDAVGKGERYPGAEESEFYDTTGWALPYAHGLRAWHSSEVVKDAPYKIPVLAKGGEIAASPVGYGLRVADREDLLAAAEARRAGVRLSIITKPTVIGGVRYERGDLFALAGRNEGVDLRRVLGNHQRPGTAWLPLPTSYPDAETREGLGSESVGAMRIPKIGVVFGDGANLASVSGVWWTLEREFRLPFDALKTSALGTRATADYTVIVLPNGTGSVVSRLKDWVREGGVLVVLGDASAIGGVGLDRRSEKTRSLPGALVRATVDPRPLLTAGYGTSEAPAELAFPISGDGFLKAKTEGGSFVRVAEKGMFLHGWSWGAESDSALSGAVLVHDEPLGQGHIIYFETDPTDRALYPGLDRMLLNALLLLPGN